MLKKFISGYNFIIFKITRSLSMISKQNSFSSIYSQYLNTNTSMVLSNQLSRLESTIEILLF